MTSDRDIYKTSGMNDCVGKPFTSQELWHCLIKYFIPINQKTGHKNVILEADQKFQRELKLLFVKNNQGKYHEIIKALEEDDIKLAHRLVHTLKSNAGQINKTILQQAAANVEHQLKEGKNLVTEEQLKILETELTMVLNELSPLLDELPLSETKAQAEPLDAQYARELIEKLEPLLNMGNPESRELIDDLHRIPKNEGLIQQLIQQIEDFNFEQAVLTLAELKKKQEDIS
jgi:HPt (histidine-containing phosphotransfer) domain-containing protein